PFSVTSSLNLLPAIPYAPLSAFGQKSTETPFPMASSSSPSLLQPAAAAVFRGQTLVLSSPTSARVPFRNPRHRSGVVSIRAEAEQVVLMDKSEALNVNRLKTNYLEKIVPRLMEEFSYTNIHQVPKVKKIVLNCGIGEAAQNAKGLDAAVNDLALIAGQRPVKTRAKNSVATFKIREGQPLGIAVTLRGTVMYAFLDRLINLGLPRTRDFQGLNPNSFDGHGNYSIGIQEQGVFPEIKFDLAGKPRGMDVCITTTANTDQEAHKLLALMGMPFREDSGIDATGLVRKKKLKSHHFDPKARGKSSQRR
ncbi:50S ribosomal protein L5, chloroplastic, partial [Linum perenne]